jgi:TolB protein
MRLFLLLVSIGLFDRQTDVGNPTQKGSAQVGAAHATYEVTGGGANIWGTSDQFHFLWKKLSGDMSLSARVRFVGEGKVAHRKAGLMVRQTLEADSPWAGVMLHGDGLTSLQYRETAGGPTKEVRSTVSAPAVIQLVRKGDTFTFWVAREGATVAEAGSIKLALQDPVYVGLAVCSHDDTVLEKAIFSEVQWSH